MVNESDVFRFDSDDEEVIKAQLKELFDKEESIEGLSEIKLALKGKNKNVLAVVFKEAMKNENLKNKQLLLNIICLLKAYFTFDESFFQSEDIFFNNTITLIDLKKVLKDDIENLSYRIALYFISICRSLNKVEYTMLDSYQPLPYFYHTLFLTLDMITLSSILCSVKEGSFSNCCLVRDANLYFDSLMNKYMIGNELMNSFLNPLIQKEGQNGTKVEIQ